MDRKTMQRNRRSLGKNNSKKAYKIIKDLTQQKLSRATTIQDKNGVGLTDEKDITNRWTEYCSDLYNHRTQRDPNIIKSHDMSNKDNFPILREEIVAPVRSLKNGKAAGADNIPAELIKYGGTAVIDILTKVCNKICLTGEWPTPWTRSLIITLPKKGLQKCQNYRTISLISHASKVTLKVILSRLRPQAEEIITEKKAGFRCKHSTTEQIFNLRILREKLSQRQQNIYHVFIDFKKAFDRVWHEALWDTMNKYNIGQKLIQSIKNLYSKATSAVFVHGRVGDCFHTTVGVCQGCLLSPTPFNIFLERMMVDALNEHSGTISIGGRTITNLRFADDIDGLAGSEEELARLVSSLDQTALRYGMEISAEKTKLMTNSVNPITIRITVAGKELERAQQFKYLGAIINEQGSKAEILARAAQTSVAMGKLKSIWKDQNISLKTKLKLQYALIYSIFLYACESWTLTAELQRRIQTTEL